MQFKIPALYKNNDDGILDLELVPTHTSNVTRGFTTWGPDFIGEEGRI